MFVATDTVAEALGRAAGIVGRPTCAGIFAAGLAVRAAAIFADPRLRATGAIAGAELAGWTTDAVTGLVLRAADALKAGLISRTAGGAADLGSGAARSIQACFALLTAGATTDLAARAAGRAGTGLVLRTAGITAGAGRWATMATGATLGLAAAHGIADTLDRTAVAIDTGLTGGTTDVFTDSRFRTAVAVQAGIARQAAVIATDLSRGAASTAGIAGATETAFAVTARGVGRAAEGTTGLVAVAAEAGAAGADTGLVRGAAVAVAGFVRGATDVAVGADFSLAAAVITAGGGAGRTGTVAAGLTGPAGRDAGEGVAIAAVTGTDTSIVVGQTAAALAGAAGAAAAMFAFVAGDAMAGLAAGRDLTG